MKLIHKTVAYTAPALRTPGARYGLTSFTLPPKQPRDSTIREKFACVRDVTMVKTSMANAK